MSDKVFRIYTGNDLIGAELCGAIKNVVAIACGAANGYGTGRLGCTPVGLRCMWRCVVYARCYVTPVSLPVLCGVPPLGSETVHAMGSIRALFDSSLRMPT